MILPVKLDAVMTEKELTSGARLMLGDYRKALLAMSVPLFISLMVAQANTFIDTFWCSMLGSKALAAIGVVASYYCILVGIGSGVGIGVSAVVASYVARNEKDNADRAATQAIVSMCVIGLVCTPVLLFIGNPILDFVMGDAAAESREYALPFYLGAAVIVVQGVLVGILRGEGAAKRSMTVTASTAVMNMVFDPLFAFGLNMGIGGLAWATVVSSLLSFVPFFYWYSVKKDAYVDLRRAHLRPERKVCSEMFAIGVPKALEIDIMWGMNFVCCYFIMICGGSDATAVYTTGWKYVDIIQTPANALAAALIPICSAAFALKDRKKLRSAYRFAMFWSLAVTAVLATVLFAAADYAVMIFSNSGSSEVLEEPMAEAIRIFVIVAVLFAAITVAGSLLQSIRRSACSMWSTLARNVVLVITFALLCGYTPTDMWWGFVATEVFGLVLMVGWAEKEYKKQTRFFDAA